MLDAQTQSSGVSATRVFAAILAAGASNRFNGIKALAVLGGETLLQRQYNVLASTELPTVAVIGAHQEHILPHLCELQLPFVVNPQWMQGQRSSVTCAASIAPSDCDGLLLLTVDQVCITAKDLARLVRQFNETPDCIVCAAYSDTRGVPAIFPKRYFAQLAGLEADRGAQHLLHNEANIRAVAMPNASTDVNTQDALARINDARECDRGRDCDRETRNVRS